MTQRSDSFFIYYMRFLAVLLIVNSHFNSNHITDFEPFALYGYLGSLGNMIFFYISSYVLTIGFDKYENKEGRWVLYRLFYLVFIIVTVRFVFQAFGLMAFPNPVAMVWYLFSELNFVSDMLYLSVLFPFFYRISAMGRYVSIVLMAVCVVTLMDVVGTEVIDLLVYSIVFLMGIGVAKDEIRFLSDGFFESLAVLVLSLVVFFICSIWHDDPVISIWCKVLIVYALFRALERIDIDRLPDVLNKSIKLTAELSLYIYLTHFFFIDFSYHMSRYFGVLILIMVVLPICYIERRVLDPVVLLAKDKILYNLKLGFSNHGTK